MIYETSLYQKSLITETGDGLGPGPVSEMERFRIKGEDIQPLLSQ